MTSIATSQNSQQQHAQKKPERGGEAHWLGLSEGLGGIIKHLPRSVEVSPEQNISTVAVPWTPSSKDMLS